MDKPISIPFDNVFGAERGDLAANAVVRKDQVLRERLHDAWQKERNPKMVSVIEDEDEGDIEDERIHNLLEPRGCVKFESLYGETAGKLMGAVSDALKRGLTVLGEDPKEIRRIQDEWRLKAFSGNYEQLIETGREYLFKYVGVVTAPYDPDQDQYS